VRFDHSGVAGSCNTCHNGTGATGKPSDHFVTTQQCDSCHSTNSWTPALDYRHLSAGYPGDHGVRLSCSDCHASNSQLVPWPAPAYAPDCAACHANDYDPGEHRGTLSQNRDCAGSGCHRVSDRDWD
jgi:hypothetical protein